MQNNKKIAIIVGIILVVVILILSLVFIGGKVNGDDVVKVKENVNIITSETEIALQPTSITEDRIYFSNNPQYEVGDVIVAGIIDSAPNGFIRKVVSISELNGVYEYKTEAAVLTDVFEEAHIIKTFAVTNEEVKDINEIDNGVMALNLYSAENAVVQPLVFSEHSNAEIQQTSAVKIKPSDNGVGVVVELDEKIGKSLEIDGQAEINTYFEIKIDIEDEEIDFGIALHTDTSGELFVGCQKELFDKDNKDKFDGTYEKEILSKALPNIQFLVGPVPIVVTNDFELTTEISAQLEGQIGTTIELDAKKVSGFEYSSKTNSIKEINEKKYLSEGMRWKTEARAAGELEAGIYAHLITKLYGSTGTDLSVGIAGDVDGEIGVGVDEERSPILFGNLSLSINPKVAGYIVVTTPVVDYELVNTEILKVKLPAFWEKKWEVPDPMLIAIKNGDFSCFAGKYIATPEDDNAYGGGEKLNPLELKRDGSLSGGGSHYSEEFYPRIKPISVEKQEDGSYLCTLNESSHYIIYPVGVIEQRDYVLENRPYLKDVVYIRCFTFDGGVLEVTYYSDSIANVVVGYDGNDWVAQEALTFEIGKRFVSGTGIEYKVIGNEQNFVSGREKLVLETQDGERWEISRIPAFQIDTRTGIVYYDIYKYEKDSNYVGNIENTI